LSGSKDGPQKRCPDCQQTLPTSDFRRNARNTDGLSTYCKPCFRRRDSLGYQQRREAAGKEYRARDRLPAGMLQRADCREIKPVDGFPRAPKQANGRSSYCKPCKARRDRDRRFVRVYGLTPEQVQAMKDSQGGRCAICRVRPAEHVDHDHRVGTVRGVLCFPCNAGLGQFGDDPAVLTSAIEYLETTTWQRTLVSPGVYQLTSPRRAARPSPTSSRSLLPT
jgi:hypothetical protein